MPPTGDVSVASATVFSSAAICASTAATRARAAAISSRRAPARSRATRFVGRPRALLRRLRRAPPPPPAASTASSRCLREPALDASRASNRCDVVGRGAQLGLCGRDVRLRRLGLRARLADVLGPRAGPQQPQLRRRLVALGLARRIASSVSAVSSRAIGVAGGDAVAFVDRRRSSDPSADLRRRRAPRSPRRSPTRAARRRPPSAGTPRTADDQQADAASSAAGDRHRPWPSTSAITSVLRRGASVTRWTCATTSSRVNCAAPGTPARCEPLAHAGAGEEQQQRRDDAAVHEQRVDRRKPPAADALLRGSRTSVCTMPATVGRSCRRRGARRLRRSRGTRSAESAAAPRPRRRWPRRTRRSSPPAWRRRRRRRGSRAPTASNMSREDLAVERRLAPEVVVDHRLVDAGGAGDAVDVGAGEAARGELGGGGGEQPLAAARFRRAGAPSRLMPPSAAAFLTGSS